VYPNAIASDLSSVGLRQFWQLREATMREPSRRDAGYRNSVRKIDFDNTNVQAFPEVSVHPNLARK